MTPSQLTTVELRALDHQHLWHPFTPMKLWNAADPLVITQADGMYLIDSDGNRYLDGVSSLWCNVHGHRVPEIDAAIRAQLDKVAHTTMLGLASEPAILLADRLMKLVPPSLKKIFYSDAGATATEVAFKLAAQYWYNIGRPEKTEFIGFTEAYHGDTVGAMSIGRTEAFHKPYFPMLFKVHYAPTPFVYRSETPYDPAAVMRAALASLEAILKQHARTIAAICIEPIVQGAAGMIVHPSGFLAEVRRLATQYDVLLICDEVAVGFGRTGKMFACEHEGIQGASRCINPLSRYSEGGLGRGPGEAETRTSSAIEYKNLLPSPPPEYLERGQTQMPSPSEGVQPDLMCVAKGITGGYLPLAATFATQKIFDAFLGDPWEGKTFYHGHTYTGNPLACAAALASLDLFEKNDLVNAVAFKAVELAKMLDELRDLPHVGDIRQKGFMVGIELVEDKATRRPFDPKRRIGAEICMKLRKHGVILRPLGDVIVMMPPLAMDLADLRTIVSSIAEEVARLQ